MPFQVEIIVSIKFFKEDVKMSKLLNVDSNLEEVLSQISKEVSNQEIINAQRSMDSLKDEEHIRMHYRMFAAAPSENS